MKPRTRKPCLCGCQRRILCSSGLPLCRSAYAAIDRGIAQMPLSATGADPVLSRRNRVMVDPLTIQAILNGDLDEAARRVTYRAEHGLYANPGPRPLVAA